MPYSVCVDVGGTFTDCLVKDDKGNISIFKSPTTPGEFEKGVMAALHLAAKGFGRDLGEFLGNVERFVHGTTVSTNALVEMKVARTGLLCTKGHPDILTLREAVRKPLFSWQIEYPAPFIPRSLTMEIGGRISSAGDEVQPLDEGDIRAAVTTLRNAKVEAVAVCFLWSTVNGKHEQRAGAIIREVWPGVPLTLSHELNPANREYSRAISAAIDASLHPTVSKYVGNLSQAMSAAGFRGEVLIANCVGGMMPANEIIRKPIYSVMSGPTLAPVAGKALSEEENLLVVDMGGTTFDVSAIRDRNIIIAQDAMIGQDRLGIPKIDVRSVGAGGGSIAWLDAGGMLKVGPQSAGALPGPMCYGRGGDEPTVTDANIVLGIIDPDYFLGGAIKLDAERARNGIAGIAMKLGTSLEDAAYAIHTTSNHTMVGAIRDITVNEGIDPRDSQCVVGGGATAAHIGEIARSLGIKRILIPKFAAGLSAFGGLVSDIRWDGRRVVQSRADQFDPTRVNHALAELMASGNAFLERAGVPDALRRFEISCYGRYEYQSWEIEVPVRLAGNRITESDVGRLVNAFHDMHERIYLIRIESDTVEFTAWKVTAVGLSQQGASVASRRPEKAVEATTTHHRQVYFHELGGMSRCPIFDSRKLTSGHYIAGPAVIEEPTTTILLLPKMRAEIDQFGNYVVSDEHSGSHLSSDDQTAEKKRSGMSNGAARGDGGETMSTLLS